jgi:hypothetical protein
MDDLLLSLQSPLKWPRTVLDYPGYNGVPSACAIARLGNTIVATELAGNPGTHVSDALEIIATRIIETLSIDPTQLDLIEEIPGRSPRFCRIALTPGDSFMHIQRVQFVGASWQPLSDDEVLSLAAGN